MRKIIIIDYDAEIPKHDDHTEIRNNDNIVYLKTGKQSNGEYADIHRMFAIAMRMRPDVVEVRANANWND